MRADLDDISTLVTLRDMDAQPRERGVSHLIARATKPSKPLMLASAALEVVAAASSIAVKVPSWAAGAVIVGIPLGYMALRKEREAKVLREQVDGLYNFDRRYSLWSSRWTLSGNSSGDFFAVELAARRDFEVLKSMPAFTWGITKRADAEGLFSDEAPSLLRSSASRTGHGRASFEPFTKTASSLNLPVLFDPPLRIGERVQLEFTIFIPRFKVASLAALRTIPAPSLPPPGESDFLAGDINFPVDEYRQELLIPEHLQTKKHGLQVLVRNNEDQDEKRYLERQGGFVVERDTIDGMPAWRLLLARANPPLKTTYRLLWQPPATE